MLRSFWDLDRKLHWQYKWVWAYSRVTKCEIISTDASVFASTDICAAVFKKDWGTKFFAEGEKLRF